MNIIYVLACVLPVILAEQKSYEGYKVYRLRLNSKNDVYKLKQLKDNPNIDIWSHGYRIGKPVDLSVAPNYLNKFLHFVESNKLENEVLIDNLETEFRKEREAQLQNRRSQFASKSPNSHPKNNPTLFDRYQTYKEIQIYLNYLKNSYSGVVQIKEIGRSFENRSINIVQISTGHHKNNPIIFIDAGIHAREWIAPAQALYIIDQLVQNASNALMIDKVDWHVIPIVNPDGYEYSMKHERLWRKTRSQNNGECFGTDGNRNFPLHWGQSGTSENTCAEDYRGTAPFSEPETQAIRNYIMAYRRRIKLYLTLHSFGPYLLYPYGYAKIYPANVDELKDLANLVALVINKESKNNSAYKVMSSAELYEAAGDSCDWVKRVGEIDLAYTIELPGGKEHQGFHIAQAQIFSTVKQLWPGIKMFHDYIVDKYNLNKDKKLIAKN